MSVFQPTSAIIALALLTSGCGDDAGTEPSEAASTGMASSDASDGSSDGVGLEPERGEEIFEEKLDVAPSDDLLGCTKIDFLFVIDDSDSMADEQQRLIDGFPGFMAQVQQTIEGFDFHVMVVGTGAQQMSFDPCENRLGTGRVRSSDGEDCGLLEDFLNGQRYLDQDHEDLAGAFECIADLGSDGQGDEKIIWSLADAITEQNDPGQCNDGFLRDDAILVVTIITDEEDSPDDGPPTGDHDANSPGDPEQWAAGLLEAKHGDEEALVVLGLLGDSDRPDALCEPYEYPEGDGAEPAVRIRQLVESFPYGSWSSVCQDDYAEFFNQAVGDIDAACGGFNPPG